ncbi:MAG: PKD domain-containing protein [Actinomycetales bacterium]
MTFEGFLGGRGSRLLRYPLHVTVLVLAVALSVKSGPAVSAAVRVTDPVIDVIGDDDRDRYVGTGGLVLPGSVDDDTRVRVAGCRDCRWRLDDPCAEEGSACTSVVRGCPRGQRLLRAWISEDRGLTWVDLGVVCIPPTGVVTVAQIDEAIQESFEAELPPTSIRFQPATGILPYLPVVFQSGQPKQLAPIVSTIADRVVVLSPVAEWSWQFGDGTRLTSDKPGAPYPDFSISHTYGRDGRFPVALTTTWRATFTIDDLGPFTVSHVVTQQERTSVSVGQGRAVLVP